MRRVFDSWAVHVTCKSKHENNAQKKKKKKREKTLHVNKHVNYSLNYNCSARGTATE